MGNAGDVGGVLWAFGKPFRHADAEPTAGMALSAGSVFLCAVFQATELPAEPDKKGGRWRGCWPCPVSSRRAEEQSGPSVMVHTLPYWTGVWGGG